MKTKLFSLLLITVLCAGKAFAWDYEQVQIGDLYYNLDADNLTAEVTYQEFQSTYNYIGLTSVNIPYSVTYNDNTFSVTSIGHAAFYLYSGLTLTIPNSVTNIGMYAFADCSSLTSITIPNSVTSIEYGAFLDCSGLTSITIPNSVAYIGDEAFSYCGGLTSITCEAESAPALGTNAFNNVDKSIPLYVPSGSIAAYQAATGWSEFTNIQAIPDAPQPEIVNPVQIGDLYYNLDADNLTAEVTYQEQNSENNYSGLTSVNIPSSVTYNDNTFSVTSIGDAAFKYCSTLTSIDIPNSVTSIGEYAFHSCSSLSSINLAEGLISIGKYAFAGGCKLGSITLPSTVTELGECALTGAYASFIVVNAGNTVYDSRDNCNAIIETATNTMIVGCSSTTFPNSVQHIGAYAFNGSSNLTNITIPDNIISIGCAAFAFSQLISLYLGDGLDSIAESAFYYCTNLSEVHMGDKIHAIGTKAFSSCNTLKSIVIPNSVTSIPVDICYASRNLESVVIPNSVTNINAGAFNSCNLTTVTIPNSVNNIGSNALCGNENLTSITCEAVTPPTLGGTFVSDYSIPLYVPSESVNTYKSAEGWKNFTKIRAIGSSEQGTTPAFPDDPGTMTYKLELIAAVIDGDSIAGQAPEGAGGYPAGTSVSITARDIPGYQFVQWSDSVTDKTRTIVIEKSDTLIAYYNRSMIEIAVAANQWTFICLPPLGDTQYTQDMFTYDGLAEVKWGTYDGAIRAEGKSGWVTPEAFNALQGYIIYSTIAGTLRINAYQDEIRQAESADNGIYATIAEYSAPHPENANWNFLGNPYAQGFDIAGLAAAGIESPITVWNGTAYSTYTPGIDEYILQPFEAFFIQKSDNGATTLTFDREYLR